ncbi:MAG: TniQ family protein [Tildeniella torsiva UHER 1998/13D]|jgi:hypothetical protein|nr:TniQ family protein [Tildeniella torsiva UHER 1998/13D]
MDTEQDGHWHFQPEPFEGESFSHFLGRYCALNCITPSGLAQHTLAGSVAIGRWRKLRYIPPPSEEQLQRLAEITGVSRERLSALLPQQPMQIGTIRLCAACYAEQPYHRTHWQYKSTDYCERHGLALLARCPCCKASFPIPAEWETGMCLRCGKAFADLAKLQKQVVVPQHRSRGASTKSP